MAINELVHDTSATQYYPQLDSFTPQDYTYFEEQQDQNDIDDHIISALKECLDEIDIKPKELFKKIVSNGHVEIPLGRLAREAIGESRASDFLGKMVTKVGHKLKARKGEGFVVAERGVGIDEELSQKLERFKVKTVNIGGVVKEGDK